MNILNALKQLRDDIKAWVTNNLNALNAKIDEKTIPIDSELSSTSTNPVQNKAIKNAIDNIPTFSGDYNDLTNAPNISEDGSGHMIIADESGNVIFRADTDGIHTTAVSINGGTAATEAYVDEAIVNIDFPETDLTGYATEDFVTSAVDSAKEELSESIVSESSEWRVVDENGNIIFSVDAQGAHTTSIVLNGESVEDMMDARVAAMVDSAPETLNTLNELASALGDDPNFATTVATEIGKKVDKVDGKDLSTNDFTDEYKATVEAFSTFEEADPTVPAWAKEPERPTYTAADVGLGNVDNTSDVNKPVSIATQSAIDGLRTELSESIVAEQNEWKIVDNNGNIIAKIDANGLETTSVAAQDIVVNGTDIKDVVESTISVHNSSSTAHTDIRNAISGVENTSLQKSGGTMTGFLTLNDDPAETYHAATKQYVDAKPDVVLKTWTSTDVAV